jgi:hypothetical protein
MTLMAKRDVQSLNNQDLIELAQNTIVALETQGEGGWNANKAELREADAELERRHQTGDVSFESASARAEIAMALRTYREAIDLWSQIKCTQEIEQSLVHYQIAVCYRRMGNVFEAKEALDLVKGEMTTKLRYTNEIQRLSNETSRFSAIHLSATAYQKMESGAFTEATALMSASAVLRGLDSDGLVHLNETLSHLVQFAQGHRFDRPAPPLPVFDSGVLLICGFEWSGSGALADCINGSDELFFPFGDTEIATFEGNVKAVDGALQILKAMRRGDRDHVRRVIISFMVTSVLGVAFRHAKKNVSQRLHRKSIAAFMGDRIESFHTGCQNFLVTADIATRDVLDTDLLLAGLKSFLGGLIHDGTNRKAVLNNCVHAFNLDCLALFDNAKAVCVIRDPRDQYAARVAENWYRRIRLERFLRITNQYMKSFYKAQNDEALGPHILPVRFEDIVLNDEKRDEIIRQCGISKGGMGKFKPELSKKNVGVYKRFENQDDIRVIEKTFPDLLFKPIPTEIGSD